LKYITIALVCAVLCFASGPDVAVYPGAIVEPDVTKTIRKTNPENAAYNSTDSFDKVENYYKKLGGEDVPHSRNVSESTKFVVMQFPGKNFRVGLSWVAGDKKHGTVIQLLRKK
jgi:hypothetical protein